MFGAPDSGIFNYIDLSKKSLFLGASLNIPKCRPLNLIFPYPLTNLILQPHFHLILLLLLLLLLLIHIIIIIIINLKVTTHFQFSCAHFASVSSSAHQLLILIHIFRLLNNSRYVGNFLKEILLSWSVYW